MVRRNVEPSLLGELAELKRRIRTLERAAGLGTSSGEAPGRIRFYDAQGRLRVDIGQPEGTSDDAVNVNYLRPDQLSFAVASVFFGTLFDAITGDLVSHGLVVDGFNGNVLQSHASDPADPAHPFVNSFARDLGGTIRFAVRNTGLTDPILTQQWAEGRDGFDVSSGSFSEVAEAQIYRSDPNAYFEVRLAITSGSPTIEWQIRRFGGSNEVVWGPETSDSDGWFWAFRDLANDHDDRSFVPYLLEARVSSGSGSARLVPTACFVGTSDF